MRTLLAAAIVLELIPLPAHAWSIGYPLDSTGCHEPITAQVLRNVRRLLATAPPIVPTRDEAAMIDDVPFSPPADFVGDLAGIALLFGVRDNDVKGQNIVSSLDLIEVHGSPTHQEEHCIRAEMDDGSAGEVAALAACRAFIRDNATAALDGLDANGAVDPNNRIPLDVYLSIAGSRSPLLPLFYVKMGLALHALEDGFTHTYRNADGTKVTVVLNWIEWVTGNLDEARDGPPHLASLDHCTNADPLIVRNVALAEQAGTELMTAALDPSLTREQKVAEFDAITARYLTFEEGCNADNMWCDAAEPKVIDNTGCGCGIDGRGGSSPWAGLPLAAIALALALGRRRAALGVLLLLGTLATQARAQTTEPPAAPAAPAVPAQPTKPGDVQKAEEGKEPGRDAKTPTVAEVKSVREDKRLGPALGFAASFGASPDRLALVGRIGLRYRLDENWILGLDGEWNPWITTTPWKMRGGTLNISAEIIRRFPMSFDRVNLRSTLRLGTSTLLFDVLGAPKYSTGPFLGLTLLGIDVDLGGSLRLVIDPWEFSIPIPVVSPLPLYYEQFRFMIGLQYGS
jgi:MYXO-CTERM domain-containing protein